MTSTERVRRYRARQRINRDVEYRLLPVDAITPQQARAAALAICSRAKDAGDAAGLLAACGLIPSRHGKFRTYAYGRKRSES